MGFWIEDRELSSEDVGGKEVGVMVDVTGWETELDVQVVEPEVQVVELKVVVMVHSAGSMQDLPLSSETQSHTQVYNYNTHA